MATKETFPTPIYTGDQTHAVRTDEGYSFELIDPDAQQAMRGSRGALGEATIATQQGTKTRESRLQELDSMHDSASHAQDWVNKLEAGHDASKTRILARGVLNFVGIKTPTQKAIAYHQTHVDKYNATLGSLDPSTHDQRRDHIISREFGNALADNLSKRYEAGDPDAHEFMKRYFTGEHPQNVGPDTLVAAYDQFIGDKNNLLPSEAAMKEEQMKTVEDAKAETALTLEESRRDVDSAIKQARLEAYDETGLAKHDGYANLEDIMRRVLKTPSITDTERATFERELGKITRERARIRHDR